MGPPLNFPMALKEAAELLNRVESASEDERYRFRDDILRFMHNEEACRGFFVVYLTDDRSIADNPPDVIIDAVNESGEIAASVLARNLVMSAATRVVHERKGDSENAAGSKQVTARTQTLIKRCKARHLYDAIEKMEASLKGQSDHYATFFARVNYDHEQKEAAEKAITELLRK